MKDPKSQISKGLTPSGEFLRRHARAEDRWLIGWLAAMLAAAGAAAALNAAFFHYTGISYLPRESTPILFPLLELAAFGLWARERSPRLAFVVRNYAFFGLVMCAVSLMVTGIQYTPFRPIDPLLGAADAALGFRVPDLMAWTYAHPPLLRAFRLSYMALDAEMFVLPFAAAFFQDRRATRVFLYAAVYSFLAGGVFYYFFPSSGPASLFASPLFTGEQRLTYWKFYAVHHRAAVTTLAGGMIAFPSFHVVWATLLASCARPRRWLFWPAVALNALIVASTVFLGWHYLVDLPAGLLLALACLWAAERSHARLSRLDAGLAGAASR